MTPYNPTVTAQVMPPGGHIFNEKRVKMQYQLYRENLLIVHNNFIRGHDAKRERFRAADLWEVDDWVLPTCGRRNLRA